MGKQISNQRRKPNVLNTMSRFRVGKTGTGSLRSQVVQGMRCGLFTAGSVQWWSADTNGKRSEILHWLVISLSNERHEVRFETSFGDVLQSFPSIFRCCTGFGAGVWSYRFQNYVNSWSNHARIQYRTLAQLGLLKRFHGTLKDEEVHWILYDSPTEACRSLAAYTGNATRYARIGPFNQSAAGTRWCRLMSTLDEQVGTIPKWQGWVRSARKKLLKMTGGESPILDMIDNQGISQEISMETKIKWLQPCPVN